MNYNTKNFGGVRKRTVLYQIRTLSDFIPLNKYGYAGAMLQCAGYFALNGLPV